MRRDQLHATPGQFRIQSVRLVGVVADEMHRELTDKPLSKGGLYQRDFVRRGALNVDGDRKALAIGDGHYLRPLAALRLAHAGASLLGWREAPVDECFLQVQVALVVKRLGKDIEDAPQHAERGPTAETAGGRFDTTDSDPAGQPTVLRSSGSTGCH